MNAAALKLLACALMVVDHVGIIFFPHDIWLRLIGRQVFPLFAYLIAEGYRHTHDVTGYLGRLVMFALISQPFYDFAFRYPHHEANVLFTLAMGLYAIIVYDKTKSIWGVLLIGAACECIHSSYGLPGVLVMTAIHATFNDQRKMALVLLPLFVLSSIRGMIWRYALGPAFPLTLAGIWEHSPVSLVQPLAVASVLILSAYTHKRGPGLKYFFYLFYPVHLGILGLIRQFLR